LRRLGSEIIDTEVAERCCRVRQPLQKALLIVLSPWHQEVGGQITVPWPQTLTPLYRSLD